MEGSNWRLEYQLLPLEAEAALLTLGQNLPGVVFEGYLYNLEKVMVPPTHRQVAGFKHKDKVPSGETILFSKTTGA